MFIKNKALANTELLLPGGLSKTGDAEGVFEVPDEIGATLVETPGWSKSDNAPVPPEKADPVAALKAAREAQKGQSLHIPPQPVPPAPAPPAVTEAPKPEQPAVTPAAAEPATEPAAEPAAEPPSEDEDEGPNLAEMSREELLDVAKEYGVKLSKALKEGDVEKLRSHLDKEIYGE